MNKVLEEEPELEVNQEPKGENLENEAAPQETAEDEVTVSIGEPAPAPTPEEEEQQKAPEWVRELRKKHREEVKRNKELEAKLQALTAENKPAGEPLAKKPLLEDFDFDTEKYEVALADWFDQKRRVEEEKKRAKDAEAKAAEEWQNKLTSYAKAKAELKVRDMDEAEAEIMETLNPTQQGIILQGSDNAALVIYALGKNPEQAKKVAAETDPVKFAFAIAKLEDKLKITKKSSPPPPESKVTGTGRTAGTVDSTLDRLRAEAEKTGDYTKVARYKAQLRDKRK